MKPQPTITPQAVVDQFNRTWAPWIRCLLLPPMVSALAVQDFDELWSQLEPHLVDDLLARERSRESLAMVERWAHEARELGLKHRSERQSEDSTIES